ncbi:hypothetical protein SUGI_0477130 [Cryptomeria japonica]|uniref:glutathione S-transferase U17 n=1 Tax=Cryptomeria japonica TaxID=3369 RepID=UPI002408EAB7|nr:glutathione S-transferase U17 [Cryptomeria japonica]GLJ24931.1 hypothetical protein SUGI_0477130 [Cryptomeria japonica]
MPRLLPNDPYLLYLVRFWSDYKDKKQSERMVHLRSLKLIREEERSAVMRRLEEEYNEMILTMEAGIAELEQRGCLYDGKSLKYMDVTFAPSMAWFGPIEKLMGFKVIDNEKCPCLYKRVHNLMGNQVVKSTLPDGDKLMAYAKSAW